LGHGCEMAEKSGVRLHLHVDQLPFLNGARRYADEWLFPGGTCRNQQCYERHVEFAPDVPDELRQLLFTPETSGGLLVAVPPDKVERLTARLASEGQPGWIVGDVVAGHGVQVDILAH